MRENLSKSSEVFIPVIAVGELYYGAWKSKRVYENLAHIHEFVTHNVIMGCDSETARFYGEIKNRLRLRARPIPENDIWIAAIALQHDLRLATRDMHFKEIEHLRIEKW